MTEKRKPMLLITSTYPAQYILLDSGGKMILWGENAEADKCIAVMADGFETILKLRGGIAIGNHSEAS